MWRTVNLNAWVLALALAGTVAAAPFVAAQDDEGTSNAQARAAARRLADRDPLVRQRAAEELARLAAVDQKKLVEGYRLQEKNDRVKLALDWALYRMGKNSALFAIVRALDSSRYNQAYAYLTEIESPEPLYAFLERVNRSTQIRLLEVLARIGNDETLGKIKPYMASSDPKVADAARFAAREIQARLAAVPAAAPSRQRQVGAAPQASP
jgi:hypothetical protein